MFCRSVNRPHFIRVPASSDSCRLWDSHLKEEDLGDGYVESMKFSRDGSLFAAKRRKSLVLWNTSAWKCMWSVSCSPRCSQVYFSLDGLRVLVKEGEKFHAHDVRSGGALGVVGSAKVNVRPCPLAPGRDTGQMDVHELRHFALDKY